MDSKTEKIIEVLETEYTVTKSEMSIYISLFHKHSNLTPILIGSIFAALAGILSISVKGNERLLVILDTSIVFLNILSFSVFSAIILFLFLSFLIIGMFYLSAAMGYLYIIELLAQRVRNIEDSINRHIGERLMVWEIDTSQKFIRDSTKHFGLLVPNKLRVFWSQISFYFIWICMAFSGQLLLGKVLWLMFLMASALCLMLQIAQIRNYWRVIVPSIRGLGVQSAIVSDLRDGRHIA